MPVRIRYATATGPDAWRADWPAVSPRGEWPTTEAQPRSLESGKLILLHRSLTTSRVGGFLRNSSKISQTLRKRAAQIEVLLMDVDGTMTEGAAGLRTGCITGRQSSALLRRAREMNMEFIYMKQPLKMPAYEEILRKAGVPDSSVAYVGDDLPDLPVMHRAGLAVAVGNAVPEVKKAAHYVTKARAGHGAIRETVELILKSKGIWEAVIDKARA